MSKDTQFLARVAWFYYIEGLTQKEIAKRFGISRVKVVRLLKEARRRGIVEIRIADNWASYLPLERALRQRFGLLDAVVVETPPSPDRLRPALGKAAAEYLRHVMRSGLLVGLGMGRTLAEIPHYMHAVTGVCHFIEMVGGIGRGLSDSYKVSSSLADRCGGQVEHLYSPVIVETAAARQALLSDGQISSVLQRAATSDLALVSVGTVDLDSFLYQAGYLDEAGIAALLERGAVGDILGQFFDIRGGPVFCPTDDRLIGLSLEQLRQIPRVVCVAGGPTKVASILGALRGRYANVLITDVETAQSLLNYVEAADG